MLLRSSNTTRMAKCLTLAWLTLGLVGCDSSSEDVSSLFTDEGNAALVPVQQLYRSINAHSFDQAADFATEDWTEISSAGVWTRGRAAVVAEAQQLYAPGKNAATAIVQRTALRFATDAVALVTTSDLESPATPPDHVRSSFVVVKRDGRWQLLNGHHTWMSADAVETGASAALDGTTKVDAGPPVGLAERESLALGPVTAYFAAFNAHSVKNAADFMAEDCDLINPFGSWRHGRSEVVAEFRDLLATILKNVTFTIDETQVRFASDDVAVVTSTHSLSEYKAADGIKLAHQRMQSTFVVINRDGRWLMLSSQHTSFNGN